MVLVPVVRYNQDDPKMPKLFGGFMDVWLHRHDIRRVSGHP